MAGVEGLPWSTKPGAGGNTASQRERYIYKLMEKTKNVEEREETQTKKMYTDFLFLW
jgi:hypothetical protein